jgi:pimeloyl-ACP methyl ester carboxylesterase
VIGWGGASESFCAVCMLTDADVAGAFTDVLRVLAEAGRDRVQHRGPLSGNQRDGLYLDSARRGCTDMQQPNQHRRQRMPTITTSDGTQTGGHDMDHYADDLAALTDHLDLRNAIHVGHSTGGGEVVRFIGRHGENRVSRAVRPRGPRLAA